jgi:hypothetical protein
VKPALRNKLLAGTLAIPAAVAAVLLASADASTRSPASPPRTSNGKPLPAERLGNSDYCGHCHTQIFHEWNSSAHHFSSLNNPVYRSVVLATAERRDPKTLQFCAGCHEPLPLAAGEPISGRITQWSSTAGITCLACHRITEVHGGNASYTLSAPTLHPFALSDHPWQQRLHRWLLATFPALHRAVLSKPLYGTAEYCATCHSVTSPREINGHGDLLLQNEYESWHKSRFAAAGKNAKSCADCHMPQVPSSDPAAHDGRIRSHRFLGGNTLLPHLNRDHEQQAANEAFLRSGAVDLQCASIRTASSGSMPCAGAHVGHEFEITFELRNFQVGHDFPGGTNDSNQAWLEVSATDSSGRIVYHSGAAAPAGDPQESSYALRTVYADANGERVDRRTATTDAITRVATTVLTPGERRNVPYAIRLDEQTRFPVKVDARLNWRKFSTAFLRSVFDAAEPPQAPLTIIDEVSVEIASE